MVTDQKTSKANIIMSEEYVFYLNTCYLSYIFKLSH